MKFPFIDPTMEEAEYFGLPYASNSILKILLDRSPAHARYALDHPSNESTPAKAFGRIFHLKLLQPERQIHVIPEDADGASNYGKEQLLCFWEIATGKASSAGTGLPKGKMLSAQIADLRDSPEGRNVPVASQSEYDLARRMRDAVMARSIGRTIFEDGQAEVSMGAELLDVKVKSRMDWLPTDHHLIADPKSAEDASYEAFSRSVARYGYARQAALYRRVYQAVTGSSSEPAFVFVVVEKQPPFDVGFYELDADSIHRANEQLDTALYIWSRCEEADIWPGTGWDWNNNEYVIQELSTPKWA